MSDPDLRASRIMDLIEGRLAPADAERLRVKLRDAPEDIQDMARWLDSFAARASAARLESPPDRVRRELIAAFRSERGVHAAEPLFDSRSDAVGVRSVGLADRWSLIHTSDAGDIATDYVREGDRVEVRGQVLAATNRIVSGVELWDGHTLVLATTADDLGQFDLGTLPVGTYRLLVLLNGATVSQEVQIS